MVQLESVLTGLYVIGAIGIAGLLVRFLWLEWFVWRNSNANVETCGATVYAKDQNTHHLPQGRVSSSVHFITFHTDAGDVVTVYMGPRDYYAIEEGSHGTLTWQGKKFWKFIKDT